jgi:hypothetical protein
VSALFSLPASMPDQPTEGWRAWAVAQRDAARAHYEIDGRVIVDRGRLCAADVERIRDEARDAASRLWERMRAVS